MHYRRLFSCLTAFLLAMPVAADDLTVSPAAIAEAYGFFGWNQIEKIEFTFNVKLPNRDETVKRGWIWNTKIDSVIHRVETAPHQWKVENFPLNYVQQLEDERIASIHQQFINDTYWLLFPFQLVWSNPHVTRHEQQPLPMGGGKGLKFICQWPDEGGYTPGDAYDLYLGEDGLIQQWVFRRGGQPEGNAHTWEDHRQLGPIIVSLDHHGPDSGGEGSGFRLWFTDVKATLIDGTVVEPQPIAEP